jgi:hypothetical protein
MIQTHWNTGRKVDIISLAKELGLLSSIRTIIQNRYQKKETTQPKSEVNFIKKKTFGWFFLNLFLYSWS